MRGLDRRVRAVGRAVEPLPDPRFLAYARAAVAYGGGDPSGEAAVGLARWLESGRRRDPCGSG